ncbi:MAG: muconolactone Delta-isomerase family protein [Bacteroidota bacterium]
MNNDYQFMVDFTMPEVLSDDFMNLIPYQRAMVQRYFNEGKLLNYALSLENAKLWAIFSANSEYEVMDMLADLPLTEYMQVEISMLTLYNTTNPTMPQFSKN